jgi:hypothetical protein
MDGMGITTIIIFLYKRQTGSHDPGLKTDIDNM